jgi:hypothetical protein
MKCFRCGGRVQFEINLLTLSSTEDSGKIGIQQNVLPFIMVIDLSRDSAADGESCYHDVNN